jgi:RNA polymerase sigma-70 factor (ECF subfamily)
MAQREEPTSTGTPRDAPTGGDAPGASADSDAARLVGRASHGDASAIEQLLADNLPRLRAYVRLKAGELIRARESCSDLVQSVCREVLEELPGFEYRGESAFRYWLMQRALHKIVDRARYYRVGARDARVGLADAAPDLGVATFLTPSRDAVGREELVRMERAFEQLPEDYREAIFLHKVVGMQHREIAAALDRSEGAARNLVYRGIARLSQLMHQG